MVDTRNLSIPFQLIGENSWSAGVEDGPGKRRANMPVQIVNSHGYKADGKTVNFVSVGSVNPETGILTLDESAILWPGSTRVPPNR